MSERTDDDVTEDARAIMRSFRRTVPAEDMLKRVRPVGSDLPFGSTVPTDEQDRDAT